MFDGDHVGEVYAGLDHPKARFEGGRFERCRFERCTFTGARFVNARFDACTFVGCELTTLGVDGSSFDAVRFTNCRAMGIDWTAAYQLTFGVVFEQCRLDNSTFSGMRLKRFEVRDCSARGVDLTGCDLTGARFPKTDLGGALIRHATVRGADFAEASGFAFDRTNKAGKTRVNLETAAQVLADLGLVVPDLDRLLGR